MGLQERKGSVVNSFVFFIFSKKKKKDSFFYLITFNNTRAIILLPKISFYFLITYIFKIVIIYFLSYHFTEQLVLVDHKNCTELMLFISSKAVQVCLFVFFFFPF